jgi:hypothetical protein
MKRAKKAKTTVVSARLDAETLAKLELLQKDVAKAFVDKELKKKKTRSQTLSHIIWRSVENHPEVIRLSRLNTMRNYQGKALEHLFDARTCLDISQSFLNDPDGAVEYKNTPYFSKFDKALRECNEAYREIDAAIKQAEKPAKE